MTAPAASEKKLILPDFGDMLFMFAFLVQTRAVPEILFGDGSTGWHLLIGQYVLNHGSVPYQDFISYTFPGKPWIAFYWLPDVAMALADRLGGNNAIAVLAGGIISWLFFLLYQRCRKSGLNFLACFGLTMAGITAASIHWLARPHIVTFLGTYFFATTLEAFHRKEITLKRMLITLGIAMLIWVNSHPGFVIGFALTGIYLFSALVSAFFNSDRELGKLGRNEAKDLLYVFLVAGAATFINPYGIALHQNVGEYLGVSQVTNFVQEYFSPVFHGGLQSTALELLLILPILGLAVTKKRPSLPQTLTVLAFFHLTLNAVRNIPLYAIIALPYIAELFANADYSHWFSSNWRRPSFVSAAIKWWEEFCENVDSMEARCTMHLLPLLTVIIFTLIAANGGRFFGQQFLQCDIDPGVLPTKTLECIKEYKLPVKEGLNEENWGGYIFWKLGTPVFIDDRCSFYGEPFYLDYAKMVCLFPGWKEKLNKLGVTWIIFRKDQQFARRLTEDPDWRILCEDKVAYLFVKKGSAADKAAPSTGEVKQ